MKRAIAILALSLTAAQLARAADSAAPQLELKKKSSFSVNANGRNPFWPIGWKPAPKVTTPDANEHSGPEIPPSAFVVTSITVDPSGRYAIVNGRAMQEGQQFGLQMGTQTYQLSVKAIQDGRVILSRRGQEIVVPLRRK